MNKVICDICGTEYSAAAKCCPLCGSSREYALQAEEAPVADFQEDEIAAVVPPRKNREIFDYDEVNQEKPKARDLDEDDLDDDEEYEEDSGTNVGLVIILVILIVLLLLASGFFFVRYLLPNLTEKPEQTQPVATTAAVVQTEPVETTELTIPCTNLMMDGGKMELGKDGMKLLNVHVYPENTTDALIYSSGDEAVVTVSDSGTVTAVGEGETVVTVQCGSQKITCNVTVDFSVAEETVPEGTIPAMQAEDGEQETTAETQGEETVAAEETAPVETTAATIAPDAELKLKKDDITISSNYTSVQLELEGDLDPAKLSWFTMDSTIAIVHGGLVTSTGSGMTRVYGEYNGQQVMCIVRCIF